MQLAKAPADLPTVPSFLLLFAQAELEAAAAEGRSSVRVELDNGGVLEVPLGDEYVVEAATGVRYHIKWGQDEAGNLQVGTRAVLG